jgi:L-malate glycosyltransferase
MKKHGCTHSRWPIKIILGPKCDHRGCKEMNHKIYVCHVVSGDLWAGAEVMCYNLLKGLKDYGDLSLTAIVLNEGQLASSLRQLGIPVAVLAETDLSSVYIYKEMKRFIDSLGIQVVHSHRYKENILSFLATRNRKGIIRIATQHGMPEQVKGSRPLRFRIISRLNAHVLCGHFNRIVVVSKDIGGLLEKEFGFPKGKIIVIHNGVDIPPVYNKKEGDLFVIGSAGRLFPVKDYPLMVEVAREICNQIQGVRFELAGEGPEKKMLEGLIEKYGLKGSFRIRGFLPDLSEFYRELDLYVNTSKHEGLPISILEAMARGIPVVATDVGGVREIVMDGVEGSLVQDRNPVNISEKCIRFIQDKNFLKRASIAAREKIEGQYSISQMAKAYHDLYLCSVEGDQNH